MGEQNKITEEEIKKEAFSFVTRFTPPFDVLSYESFKDIVFEAFVYGFEFSAQQTAALREELEEVNELLSFYKRVNENNIRLHDKMSEELEAVKKEKDEFDSKIMELMIHHEKQLSEVTRQRDELSNLLRRSLDGLYRSGDHTLRNEIISVLGGQSSGEKKPVSPEIVFHLLENENPPYPEENVLWYRDGEPPYVGSMLDEDFPGLAYFYAWCNIPEPPKHLTDKSKVWWIYGN